MNPLVSTDLGLIKLLRADDGSYSIFLGTPFAVLNADNPFGASVLFKLL